MADVVIGTVKVGSTSAGVEIVTAGAAISAGDCVYKDITTSEWIVSDCTAATTDSVEAIAYDDAVDGGPLTIIKPGADIDLGATLTVGEIYVLSVSGAICPVADLASADYVTIVGYGKTADLLKFKPYSTGYLRP